ncbi:hypothetical protein GCM10023338_19300 [Wohlfahrtiimonas larvae]|uniref:Lipoprotein n=2 Tax=Wohlfahrtiimonas larvae TaxID=1157986 RepID=A0ABP9MUF2_9GAMM
MIKNRLSYVSLQKRILIIASCSITGYCGYHVIEYLYKKQQFEINQIHNNILMTQLIYSVRKDRPYTVYESSLSRTNEKEVLDHIRGNEVLPSNEYKRDFNLAKRALLDIEKQSLFAYSTGINNPEICQKDQRNELYRCHTSLKKANGTHIYFQAIVYFEPKAYQDYLRFGFHEKAP